MTFAGAPLSLVGPALAVGAARARRAYLLKMRRRRFEVPFAELWRRVLVGDAVDGAVEAAAPPGVAAAAARPVARCILFALARSAAVGVAAWALDRHRRRRLGVDEGDRRRRRQAHAPGGGARRRRAAWCAALGGDDEAMIVAMDARPAPRRRLHRATTARSSHDVDALRGERHRAPTSLRALGLAGDALRGRPRPTLVLHRRRRVAIQARARTTAPRALGQTGRRRALPARRQVAATTSASSRSTCAATSANKTAYEVLVEVQSFRAAAVDGDAAAGARRRGRRDAEADARRRRARAAALSRSGRRRRAPRGAARRRARRVPARRRRLRAPAARSQAEGPAGDASGDLFLEGALLSTRTSTSTRSRRRRCDAAASAQVRRRRARRLHAGRRRRARTRSTSIRTATARPFAVRGSVDGAARHRDGGGSIRSCAG